MNKKKLFTLKEYEPSLEKQKIKDNIYFSIDEIKDKRKYYFKFIYYF